MKDKKKYTNCDSVYKELQLYFVKKNFELSDRVPSERQIADDLGFNRTTLRTAMHRMVKEGLLERQVGVGTFFKINPQELSENFAKISTKCTHTELLEARIMLEPKLANLAAINATIADVKKLKNVCSTSKKINGKTLEEMDIIFHDIMAEISKNNMLKQMYMVVSNLRKKLSKEFKELHCESYECSETWKKHKQSIIEALEKRDGKAAYKAAKEKLDCVSGQHSILS